MNLYWNRPVASRDISSSAAVIVSGAYSMPSCLTSLSVNIFQIKSSSSKNTSVHLSVLLSVCPSEDKLYYVLTIEDQLGWKISGIFRSSAVLKTINLTRWKLPLKENNCKKRTTMAHTSLEKSWNFDLALKSQGISCWSGNSENDILPGKVIENQWKSLRNIDLKKLDLFHIWLSCVFRQRSSNR